MITIDDFKKVELKIAKILAAERVSGSDKLLRLEVDLGEEKRQIVAGIGTAYGPETLIGKEVVIIANLEPRMLMGFESQGMLLATGAEETVLLVPEREVDPGSSIR